MVLVGGAIFHFCDPTPLEKVAKIPPKGFVVQKQCATLRLQCPNSSSRGETWPINTRESTMLDVVVERWLKAFPPPNMSGTPKPWPKPELEPGAAP
eukprot:SAG31_NODE_4583_length_3118_cov_2.039086_2_plen_96_part_00